jgi:hypothetical protein
MGKGTGLGNRATYHYMGRVFADDKVDEGTRGSKDAAQLSGAGGRTGIGLLEIYEVR